MSGSLPDPTNNASELRSLDLSYNSFTGTLTSNLTAGITSLRLAGNSFQGSLPQELWGKDKLLTTADFSHNEFSGTLPNVIGNTTSLVYFYADDNMFTGPIPATLASLSKLRTLTLNENLLEEDYPQALCNLTLLTIFRLASSSSNIHQCDIVDMPSPDDENNALCVILSLPRGSRPLILIWGGIVTILQISAAGQMALSDAIALGESLKLILIGEKCLALSQSPLVILLG